MTHAPSARTEVKRLPDRARYDRTTVEAILDEGFVAHVGFAGDDGPVVLPMAYGRDGDTIVLHGSAANHLLRSLKEGAEVCATVTLVDGLVLSRAAFHHSINYRSVVVMGRAEVIEHRADKAAALDVLVEHLVPGRTAEARAGDEKELRTTLVLRLGLAEASAKVRTGPPLEDEGDLDLPVWAGVLPLALRPGTPIPDPHTPATLEPPGYLASADRFQD